MLRAANMITEENYTYAIFVMQAKLLFFTQP